MKTETCYVMQGKVFSSKYENGNKPIPLTDVYCIHLVATRIHGVKGHSLDLYTQEQFQKNGRWRYWQAMGNVRRRCYD